MPGLAGGWLVLLCSSWGWHCSTGAGSCPICSPLSWVAPSCWRIFSSHIWACSFLSAGVIYQMLAIGVTFGLGGMVNRRLAVDLERDQAQRQRIEDEVRVLSRTVEQSQVSVMITDTSGAIQYVNPKFSEVTGYTADEVRGENPRILRAVGAAPALYEELWQTILAGREWRGEFHNRKKNGELYWDATIISPIVNDEGVITHFVSMKEDVTERKRAEEALLKMTAMEERQRLARNLHDSVNQSIHSLVYVAETLTAVLERRQFDLAQPIVEVLQESAHQALKETRLMLYQINQPLVNSGAQLIQSLEARLAMVERYARIKADIHLEGSLDDCPLEYTEQLFWIALEALNNALKHSQAHTLHIRLRCSPRQVELEVVDDGKGFDPAKVSAGGKRSHAFVRAIHRRASWPSRAWKTKNRCWQRSRPERWATFPKPRRVRHCWRRCVQWLRASPISRPTLPRNSSTACATSSRRRP